MSYSVNPDGKITNNANGQEVEVDITSPAYQQYKYWVSHGINLTVPAPTSIVSAPPVEIPVVQDVIQETVLEKVEDEVKEVFEEVKKLVRGQ